MTRKYESLARTIIRHVGGSQNILSVTHCLTRLRFRLKDESLADTGALKATEGIITVIQANGQYQLVIGNTVRDLYNAVVDAGQLTGLGTVDEDGKPLSVWKKHISAIVGKITHRSGQKL